MNSLNNYASRDFPLAGFCGLQSEPMALAPIVKAGSKRGLAVMAYLNKQHAIVVDDLLGGVELDPEMTLAQAAERHQRAQQAAAAALGMAVRLLAALLSDDTKGARAAITDMVNDAVHEGVVAV
jgi:hypothetical protein